MIALLDTNSYALPDCILAQHRNVSHVRMWI